jgi:hypothetical protein
MFLALPHPSLGEVNGPDQARQVLLAHTLWVLVKLRVLVFVPLDVKP